VKEVNLIFIERSNMKKHFNKTAGHGHHRRIGLGIHGVGRGYYGSPDYSPYYAYPPVVFTVHKVPPVSIQKRAPLIWTPGLLHDRYSQLMPPTVIKIAADYIGRFI
jgi:hypothetical protein